MEEPPSSHRELEGDKKEEEIGKENYHNCSISFGNSEIMKRVSSSN